jgi:hypothetical protein
MRPAQHLPRVLKLEADRHAVGAHEVADRVTLAQKLGVGGDVEVQVGACCANDLGDAPAGADGAVDLAKITA